MEKLYFCKKGGIPSLTVSDINRYNTKFVGYVEEYLTEEGMRKSKTQIIPSYTLLFIGGGVNAPQLGKVKINFVL
ncbi:restriction endonuclease subunit S domain-containing protein [Mycoplasma ovis]|uniref:hypothetical protein n=1 Tax=Mycoplasma ovis TaxID=171632 RepID=UPI00040D56E1|nr:hypothetical protein [Mycoplasma ovis]